MKVKELLQELNGKYADYECYYPYTGEISYHTDHIISVAEEEDDKKVLDYSLMSEREYAESVLVNSGWEANFEGWYGDKNAKCLVILVEDE